MVGCAGATEGLATPTGTVAGGDAGAGSGEEAPACGGPVGCAGVPGTTVAPGPGVGDASPGAEGVTGATATHPASSATAKMIPVRLMALGSAWPEAAMV